MPACRAWPRPPGGSTPSWCAASPRWGCATRRGPRRRVSCSLRPVGRAQRARLERLTAATGLVRPDAVAIAAQPLDDALGDDEVCGYARAALIPGYYAAGDDLVIYLKDLTHGVVARATA